MSFSLFAVLLILLSVPLVCMIWCHILYFGFFVPCFCICCLLASSSSKMRKLFPTDKRSYIKVKLKRKCRTYLWFHKDCSDPVPVEIHNSVISLSKKMMFERIFSVEIHAISIQWLNTWIQIGALLILKALIFTNWKYLPNFTIIQKFQM